VFGLVGPGSAPAAKNIEIAVLQHQLVVLRLQVARSWSRRPRCRAGTRGPPARKPTSIASGWAAMAKDACPQAAS